MIEPVLTWVATHEGWLVLREHADRWRAWTAARAAADGRGKPLLNVGCPRRYPFKYPCGDVCLDVDPWRLAVCQAPRQVLGDVRDMRVFPDRTFGAALCSHVLEHLPTPADAERAVVELQRVADAVYVCSPSRMSVAAWLHPEHALWVDHLPDGRLAFEPRPEKVPV